MAGLEVLEAQLVELNETVEMLTLDKEQLMIDKELLEEQITQLKSQLNHPVSSSSPSINAEEMHRLKEENEKLRDALRRLNDQSIKDKDTAQLQTIKINELTKESEELKSYKIRTEGEIEELKHSVDSMSAFESMIEKLTNENLELSATVEQMKQTISELEDTIELNEALDHQQREKIEEDRGTMESLTVKVTQLERTISEKDALLSDSMKKIENFRVKYIDEKQQVEMLKDQLSSGSENFKMVEEKVKETVILRVAKEELLKENVQLKYQIHQGLLAKLRYQTLYTRMDAIYGGTAYFIEESKLLNIELLYMSTLSSGFEAGKQLAEVFTLFSSSDVTANRPDILGVFMSVSTAYNLSIPLQGLVIQSSLQIIRDQSRKILRDATSQQSSQQTAQYMQICKSTWEKVLNACGLILPILSHVVTGRCNEHSPEYIALLESDKMLNEVILELRMAINNFMTDGTVERAVTTVLENAASAMLDNTKDPLVPIETLHLSFSAIIETTIAQAAIAGAKAPISNVALDLIKSVKHELDLATRNFKKYSAVSSNQQSSIMLGYIELLRFYGPSRELLCLLPINEDVTGNVKSILALLRKFNAETGGSEGSSSPLDAGTSAPLISLKFFPAICLTSSVSRNKAVFDKVSLYNDLMQSR